MARKFYELSPQQRRISLNIEGDSLDQPLSEAIANSMIENYLTTYEVPLGVIQQFVVNGKDYVVPMATEEPSVIAAANHGAKIVGRSGGFSAQVVERVGNGQIILTGITDFAIFALEFRAIEEELMDVGNDAVRSLVERGGGIRSFQVMQKADFVVVMVYIDPCEAMGANKINTVLETLAAFIQRRMKVNVLASVLSNLTMHSMAQVSCRIAAADIGGEAVAQKIVELSQFSRLDLHRAVTHNKGILNGVAAVALATGNDWRAVEANIHAYAAIEGKYQGLGRWLYQEGTLIGTLSLPLMVGTVGGSIRIHPKAQLALKLLGNPDAKTLMMVMVAVGLAQNLAALKALVDGGIQAGHMRLQAKSLALCVGAMSEEVDELARRINAQNEFTEEAALNLLLELRSEQED